MTKRISRGPMPTRSEKLGLASTQVYKCGCGGRTRALNGTYPNCDYCGKQWGRSETANQAVGQDDK